MSIRNNYRIHLTFLTIVLFQYLNSTETGKFRHNDSDWIPFLRSNAVRNLKIGPEMTIRILKNIRTVNHSTDDYRNSFIKNCTAT
jgi:hypothetical protein